MKKFKLLLMFIVIFTVASLINTTVTAEDEIVLKINGTDITADQFIEAAKYKRFETIQEYDYMVQIYSMYGIPIDETFNQQYSSRLSEEGSQVFGQQVLNQLAYNVILEDEAIKAGISVSDEETKAYLKQMFGYGEDTTDTATTDSTGLGSEIVEVGGEEPEINKDIEFQNAYDNFFTTEIGDTFSKAFFENQVYLMLLENKLLEESILKDHVFEDEMVSARHILVETEELSREVLDKLAAGEDWDALAAEYSMDTGNKDDGGDLGWFSKGMMVLPFEEAAFALEPGSISEPVKSDFGYHIIALDAKEIRPLEGDALENAKNAVYQAWFEKVNSESEIESFDNWIDIVPTTPEFVPIEIQATEEPVIEEEIVEEPLETTTAP